MDFTEIVMNYAPMWSPAVVAVLGILSFVIKGLTDVDKTVEKLKDSKAISELKKTIQTQACENARIKEELEKLRLEMVNINVFTEQIKSAEELIINTQKSDVEANKDLLKKVNILINALYAGGMINSERYNEKTETQI